MHMKTAIYLLVTFAMILQLAAADSPGLYLRAVVDEGMKGAVKMVGEDGEAVFVSPDAMITPDDIESAMIEEGEDIAVTFYFKPAGQDKLGKATRSMKGKQLAIIVDGELLSAPVVHGEFSASAKVTGNFTRAWAEAVVDRVKQNRAGVRGSDDSSATSVKAKAE